MPNLSYFDFAIYCSKKRTNVASGLLQYMAFSKTFRNATTTYDPSVFHDFLIKTDGAERAKNMNSSVIHHHEWNIMFFYAMFDVI